MNKEELLKDILDDLDLIYQELISERDEYNALILSIKQVIEELKKQLNV